MGLEIFHKKGVWQERSGEKIEGGCDPQRNHGEDKQKGKQKYSTTLVFLDQPQEYVSTSSHISIDPLELYLFTKTLLSFL